MSAGTAGETVSSAGVSPSDGLPSGFDAAGFGADSPSSSTWIDSTPRSFRLRRLPIRRPAHARHQIDVASTSARTQSR
jgi:hypothetical protein